jgi:hypothetical protein
MLLHPLLSGRSVRRTCPSPGQFDSSWMSAPSRVSHKMNRPVDGPRQAGRPDAVGRLQEPAKRGDIK